MVEETRAHGASVPEVALRHGVNANLLSVWRRQYQEGLLRETSVSEQSADLLPAKVTSPTLLPTQRATAGTVGTKAARAHIEIDFAGGRRLRIHAHVTRSAKLNELDCKAYPRYVLERIAEHAINKIDDLLPWNVAAQLPSLRLAP